MNRRSRHGWVLLVAFVATLGSGCVAPGPEPTSSAAPTASPSGARATSPGRSVSAPPQLASESPATGSPTPLPDPPELDVPVSTFTIVCESWGTELPGGAVECRDAVRLGLGAIGGDRASEVQRLDVGYGDRCAGAVECRRRADVRTVVARSAEFEALVLRIARDDTGELLVWPPVTAGTIPPPTFTAPQTSAPDLGSDAPVEIRDRQAISFCGTEHLSTPDAFDATARRCFVDGVLAWVPVELVSTALTEDGAVTTVFRFEGHGAVEEFVHAPSGWTATRCAISPISTPAAFVVVSPCDELSVHP